MLCWFFLPNYLRECFNPHPARRLDAIHHFSSSYCWRCRFNPHPARRLDAIVLVLWPSDSRWFQSSSSPKAGCYAINTSYQHYAVFQSSSSPKAGCYKSRRNTHKLCPEFQSSSSPKAGCYPCCGRSTPPHHVFQSSSSPKAGCYEAGSFLLILTDFVSILIQPEGWMLCPSLSHASAAGKFQSSSSPKAGCYG